MGVVTQISHTLLLLKCTYVQVAELQVRVAILNRFTQLGAPVTIVA
ncbi:hypothetical protein [Iodobacter fluviatilis]|nr:hypothetical protein [Iodobacter fluviatilis]